jgi:hypothetical protein
MIPISIVRTMVAISIVRAVIAVRMIRAIITAVGVIRTMIAVVTAVPTVVCSPIHSPVDARHTERREGTTYSGFGGVKRQPHPLRW